MSRSVRFLVAGLALGLLPCGPAHAGETTPARPGQSAVQVGRGPKGFELRSDDDAFLLQMEFRLQFRFSSPFSTDPITEDDFDGEDRHSFAVNRARMKVGGHAFRPWLEYYWEYELANSLLLDFRAMITRWSFFRVKVGQWKVHYNRERVISSGKQQMADRSLINRPFTIDRQQGVSLYGRLQGGGVADFSYWAGVFTGMGRGGTQNDDDQMMWMTRGQWNFFGRELGFSGSDVPRHEKAAGIVAVGALTNRSPYTRFSSAGGGQLEGFEEGVPGQYRVDQLVVETAWKYRGASWQQELHFKNIDDRVNLELTRLVGNYAQLGYFLHGLWSAIPEPVELAFRHAFYDPDRDRDSDWQQEFTGVVNAFLSGHRNKLTAELSWFDLPGDDLSEREGGWRVRVQWDVSF